MEWQSFSQFQSFNFLQLAFFGAEGAAQENLMYGVHLSVLAKVLYVSFIQTFLFVGWVAHVIIEPASVQIGFGIGFRGERH